jgi:hypothetical protein
MAAGMGSPHKRGHSNTKQSVAKKIPATIVIEKTAAAAANAPNAI